MSTRVIRPKKTQRRGCCVIGPAHGRELPGKISFKRLNSFCALNFMNGDLAISAVLN
jgi:hypothetical protein